MSICKLEYGIDYIYMHRIPRKAFKCTISLSLC